MSQLPDSDHLHKQCPKCGVEYVMKRMTMKRREERGGYDGEKMWLCKDCRPYKLRIGKMTGEEIWEAYKKDKGIE